MTALPAPEPTAQETALAAWQAVLARAHADVVHALADPDLTRADQLDVVLDAIGDINQAGSPLIEAVARDDYPPRRPRRRPRNIT